MTNWKWRDVASVKIKLKVSATQHHRRKRPAPAHWRAISNVRYLFGLALYFSWVLLRNEFAFSVEGLDIELLVRDE